MDHRGSGYRRDYWRNNRAFRADDRAAAADRSLARIRRAGGDARGRGGISPARRGTRRGEDGGHRHRGAARCADDDGQFRRGGKIARFAAGRAADVSRTKRFQPQPSRAGCGCFHLSAAHSRHRVRVLSNANDRAHLWPDVGATHRRGGHAGGDVAAQFLRGPRRHRDGLRDFQQRADYRGNAERIFGLHPFRADVPRDEPFHYQCNLRRVRRRRGNQRQRAWQRDARDQSRRRGHAARVCAAGRVRAGLWHGDRRRSMSCANSATCSKDAASR